MGKAFTINRVGHVGVQVTNLDRSVQWYLDTLNLSFTGRWPAGEGREVVFLRFNDDHHNIILFTHPNEVDPDTKGRSYNPLQHIALEVSDRDEWLKALAHLKRKGVPLVHGPLIHGPEGDPKNLGGSGSRSFYFRDPDGNLLEIFCEMMKVPNGEPFPRPEYAKEFHEVFG